MARVSNHYWVVVRHPADVREGQSARPLASFPDCPASNIWQAQNAMIALQRRGIRCYMDLTHTYEERA